MPFGCGKIAPDSEGFKEINKNRQCTDLLCLLLFALFCGAGAGVGFLGIANGQPEALVYGKDDNGNICGSLNTKNPPKCKGDSCFFADGKKDKNTGKFAKVVGKNEPMGIDYLSDATILEASADPELSFPVTPLNYVVYPRLVADLFEATKETPPTPPLLITFFGICLDKCPTTAGWTCSMYGKGYLADTLGLEAFPKSLGDTECPGCEKELDTCQNSGIFNPRAPIPMRKYKSEKCSTLLKACFRSSLPHTDTMFRCFPMYSNNVSYACDDDSDGLPDPDFPDTHGNPMNGGWQEEPFNATQITMCSTLIKKSLSQQAASPNFIYEQIASAVAIIGRMIADLQASMISIIFCGIAVSTACGFIWLLMLRYCARVFVWITIVLVVVMEGTITVFFYMQGEMVKAPRSRNRYGRAPSARPGTVSGPMMPAELENDGSQKVEMFKWAAIGMTIFMAVQFVGILSAIKKINVAAEIIAEASKAVSAMVSLMFFPLFPVVMISGIFLWFIYVSVCLYSTGEINGDMVLATAAKAGYKPSNATGPTGPYLMKVYNRSYKGIYDSSKYHEQMVDPHGHHRPFDQEWEMVNVTNGTMFSGLNLKPSESFKDADWGKYLLILHLFVTLWGNAFIQGFMAMVVAGAVGNWYFTVPTNGEKVQDTKLPVAASCWRTTRYHLGSIAFGSGIIALVQLARAIMTYIDHQTKHLQDKNIVLKILMKCVHCILWCFEKCIKYLTRNAYIFIALKGHSFCGAAFDVFMCLKDNMGQMVIVAGVTGYLMLIGKVVIVAISTFVCFLMVMNNRKLSSPIMPVISTASLSFFVASVFLNVYEIAIDTILISFCVDKKMNDGSEKKKYYMSNKMRILSGIEGTEDSCYARDDDGENDSKVEPIAFESETQDQEGTEMEDKSDETSKAEDTEKKGHFDTDLI